METRWLSISWKVEVLIPILPMRHGNSIFRLCKCPFCYHSDPTYEAWKQWEQINFSQRIVIFRSYLWGMETFLTKKWSRYGVEFRSYLWGMETVKDQVISGDFVEIPILPMRHGNELEGEILEEEKNTFRSYLWGMETRDDRHGQQPCPVIPILPMRHGNPSHLIRLRPRCLTFRSYLWGMETMTL